MNQQRDGAPPFWQNRETSAPEPEEQAKRVETRRKVEDLLHERARKREEEGDFW